ncbi:MULTISPECIES: class I SAM-dependent methyltransferase [unclassified Sporosarcina]|uniref:class I SAM-dependent methyltransferase n=1 Tax=unclassified Sporosarcina TaxID=2647733 RepID=UPI001E4DA80F|nr:MULTISPECIES: class I SAM-dependent methyltransferase [unclassified Sporosarcina]
MNVIITTAGRFDEHSTALMHQAADALQAPVVERKKRSIPTLQDIYRGDVLVAGKDRYSFYKKGSNESFFFHPNSATYRLKRILKGETDPLVVAADLKLGDSFLDCTLGLGSDAIIAASTVGEKGTVEGIEADQIVAFLTKVGLHNFPIDFPLLQEAMRRVQVIHAEAVDFLKTCETNSRDVVFLDPMFTTPIEESSNFEALREIGVTDTVTEEWVAEALRVCRRRVVLKDHFQSPMFERFGFIQQIRPYTKVHYGVMEK